ncbi:MAG: SPOR domain-containing protein [Chroococcales cyanobacterium]
MRHSSLVESSKPSINPVLQAALSSLDIQLESELTRYRRLRERPIKPRRQPSEASSPSSRLKEIAFEPTTKPPANNPSAKAGDSAIALPSMGKPLDNNVEEAVSTLVHQPQESATQSESAAQSDSVPPQIPPQDYLESSEKLLQTLAEEENVNEADSNDSNPLFTPLSVGAVLVLFVASMLLGSALIKPETFSHWGLDKLFNNDSNLTSDTPSVAVSPIGEEESLGGGNSNQELNLARDEFVKLSLDNLSTLPDVNPSPSVAPSPQTAPSPATAQPNSNVSEIPYANTGSGLATALLPPGLQPYPYPQAVVPYPVTVPPNPSPRPSVSEAVKAEAAPAPTGEEANLYFAIADYTGNEALEKAQEVIPDAYLRNFAPGVKIQLGAFKEEAQAKQLVTQLKEKGITASVYRP